MKEKRDTRADSGGVKWVICHPFSIYFLWGFVHLKYTRGTKIHIIIYGSNKSASSLYSMVLLAKINITPLQKVLDQPLDESCLIPYVCVLKLLGTNWCVAKYIALKHTLFTLLFSYHYYFYTENRCLTLREHLFSFDKLDTFKVEVSKVNFPGFPSLQTLASW